MSKPTYEELEAQVKQLTEANQQLRDENLKSTSALYDVVAENAALKSAIGAVNRTAEECELNGDEVKYVVGTSEFEALIDLLDETHSTDAILASLRAEGVEMCIQALVTSDDDDFSDAPNICAEVARQLRSQSAPSPEAAAIARQLEQVKGGDL